MNTIRLSTDDVRRVVDALDHAARATLCCDEQDELFDLAYEIENQVERPGDVFDVKCAKFINEDNCVVSLLMPNGKDCIDLICPVREGTFEYNCAIVKLDGRGNNTDPVGLNLVCPGHYT